MKSLLSLSASIQHLGISRDPSRLGHAANDTLRLFVIELLGDAATGWRSHERQALWDLAFLRKLADLWVDGWTKTSSLLDKTMAQLLGKVCTEIFFEVSVHTEISALFQHEDITTLQDGIAEYFSRTQVLLAPLAPLHPVHVVVPLSKDSHEKLTTLLPHGVPILETQFQPALELAKPSSRFGLLLVDSTSH